MSPLEYLTVATIVRTHGLKGEVAVAPVTATSLSLLEGASVWLVPPPTGLRQLTVERVRQGPRGLLMRFEEVASIDTASRLIGCEVLAPAAMVPEEPDDADVADLAGYTVSDPAHGDIGVITETIITGANDVWVVHGPFGEVLIPVIEQVVHSIDDDGRHIVVHLLEGLLPEGQGT